MPSWPPAGVSVARSRAGPDKLQRGDVRAKDCRVLKRHVGCAREVLIVDQHKRLTRAGDVAPACERLGAGVEQEATSRDQADLVNTCKLDDALRQVEQQRRLLDALQQAVNVQAQRGAVAVCNARDVAQEA